MIDASVRLVVFGLTIFLQTTLVALATNNTFLDASRFFDVFLKSQYPVGPLKHSGSLKGMLVAVHLEVKVCIAFLHQVGGIGLDKTMVNIEAPVHNVEVIPG